MGDIAEANRHSGGETEKADPGTGQGRATYNTTGSIRRGQSRDKSFFFNGLGSKVAEHVQNIGRIPQLMLRIKEIEQNQREPRQHFSNCPAHMQFKEVLNNFHSKQDM